MRGLDCIDCQRFGQSASMDIPQGFLDPSQTQYNNTSGSDLGIQPTYTGAPSWWDNITNELSADAENLWNDVESVGVWVEDEFNTLLNPQSVPGNPISSGYAAGYGVRQSIGQDIQGFGSTLGNAIANAGTPLIILGLIGVAAFVVLEKD